MMRRRERWTLQEDFHRYVETGFDELSHSYDEEIGANPIGRRMREIFRRTLTHLFRPRGFVFEIGCGTGIDALWCARNGAEVVATDISGEMLEELQRKAKAEGLSDHIRCRKLAARDIGALRGEFGDEAFDGGDCHAGALNLEPELPIVPPQIR